MKVKFCGMTNLDDVLSAVDLGVDFVGFVFYEKSKRYIDYAKTKRIVEYVKNSVKTVGVFVNQDDNEIEEAIKFCHLDFAQVYRDVGKINTIRAYRIKDTLPSNINEGLILFDSYSKSVGGSGTSFNLDLIKDFEYKNRLFVAGGVSADNVKQIKKEGVFGVDLVSFIETYPGKKDIKKMKNFMKFARG